MLTTRSLLLTSAGLLTGFGAAAQATPAAGPQPTDILSWVTWCVAAIVLLLAIINGVSATVAAQYRYAEAPTAEAVPTPAIPAEAVSRPEAVPVAKLARPVAATANAEAVVA